MRLGSRKLSFSGLLVLVGTLALLLSACGTTKSTQNNALPDDKQIMHPAEIGPSAGDLATLDPALINFGVDYDHAQQVFPMLITLTDDQTTQDWAAKSHEVSSDGTVYTFHLNSGMTWSNGDPIDANTFAYSINRALDPCTGSDVASYLYNIKGAADFNGGKCPAGATKSADTLVGKSIVVADPLTLKITLEGPAAYFLGAFSYPTSWGVPQKMVEQYGDKWTDHLADNGGFGGNIYKVTAWDHAGHFTLQRNDKFWGTKPKIREIDYTLYKDTGVAWSDFKAGKTDMALPISAELDIARGMAGYTEVPVLSISYLQPNYNIAPFDDARMRNAFSLALDRKSIALNVLKGGADPTTHIIIKGLPQYNADLKDSAGRGGDTAVTADTAKATELAKAYATDKCGGDLAKCPPVVFTISANNPSIALVGQAMQQQWQTAFPGLQITIATIDRKLQIKSSTLQLTNARWGADYPDAQDFTSLLLHKGADYNKGNALVPAADALEDKADVNLDAAARKLQYQQAEQLLINDGAWMPYAQAKQIYVLRSTVGGGWHYNSGILTSLTTWQKAYMQG